MDNYPEYPGEQALRFIRKYDITKATIEDLRDFVFQLWHFGDWGYKSKGRHFELHTGGWSGNEDIIAALKEASVGMFWGMCWAKSTRGGHYWFEIPRLMTHRHLKKYLAEKSAAKEADHD